MRLFLVVGLCLLASLMAQESQGIKCDMEFDRGICLFGGQKILVPDATPPGLIARYTFDDNHFLDSSRGKNHGSSVIPAVSGRSGMGHAAKFAGDTWVEIKYSEALDFDSFSMSFWIFPETASAMGVAIQTCPIISRGDNSGKETFDILIDRNVISGRINVRMDSVGVVMSSTGKTAAETWSHIAVILDKVDGKVYIYINGVRDAVADASVTGGDKMKKSFNVGAVPWKTPCSTAWFMDDFEIYKRRLTDIELAAASFPALGAVEPTYCKMGCKRCTFVEAKKLCREQGPYMLCNQAQMDAGGMQFALKMGWADYRKKMWISDPEKEPLPTSKMLGLCCHM